MNNVRATRLTQSASKPAGFLTSYLPYGSWQRRIVLFAVFPGIFLIIAGLITDKIVMPIVTRQGTEFKMPDFTGQRLSEAQISLDELELTYEIASEDYSPGKPPGTILRQIPLSGNKVKPGRQIKFVVSLGQKLIPIPNVAGKSVRQARLELEAAGLLLGEIDWALSDTLPEKLVVFSYPAAGDEIPIGSYVNLMVKHGRASSFTFMPNIEGLTFDNAKRRLGDKLLKVGVISYRTDENYLPETVLEQSEPHGAELDVNTVIDLVLSTTE
jgi:beta-lactam-binding protein with PASTA domain